MVFDEPASNVLLWRSMTFPIPWERALDGCRLAVENANRLAEDARLLRQNDRLQSAYSVSLDAWEELGKAVLLLRYWKQKQNISKADWSKVLRNHRMKRTVYVESGDILYPTSTPPKSVEQLKRDLEKIIQADGWREWFDLERNIGVYVDWDEGWRSPCGIDKSAFCSLPLDSEYWRRAVTAYCKHLRDILPP
jgi:AbiV family abortive infection protein